MNNSRLMRGRKTPTVLGSDSPYAYADVPAAIPPSQLVLLDNGMLVRRAKEGILVPAFVVDRDFELLTSLDAATYTAGSPPTGWAESGTISVAGGYIVIDAPSGTISDLTYTISGLGATETVVTVVRGYAEPVNNYVSIRPWITAGYGEVYVNHAAVSKSGFHGTGGTTGAIVNPPIDSVETMYSIMTPDAAHFASPETVYAASTPSDLYGGGGSKVDLRARETSGAGANGYFYVEKCHIYKGTLS